jgi:uncharacterized membrane protein HdeD (DUF308 family)
LYYCAFGCVLCVMHILCGTSLSLDHMFSDRHMNFKDTVGWSDVILQVASAVIGAFLLCAIVERAKKCLDFTLTLYFVHYCCCCAYGGCPHRSEWWWVTAACAVIMILLGEWLCSRRELEEIVLGVM